MEEPKHEAPTVAVEPVVGPDHVGDANKMVSDPTYEVRVAGPDDVIPMPDELSALRHANAINRAYLADRLKNPDNEVMCVAAVHAVMPPTTDEDHKKMELPTVEHALMFSRSYAAASPYLSKTAKAHITGLCDLLEATQARLTSLRRDAERYRFMRSRTITPSAAVACASAVDELYGDEMDAAIDDAMKPNANYPDRARSDDVPPNQKIR